MADEADLKASATSRFEWFVVHLLHKLTRADIEQLLEFTRNSSSACDDSYARKVVQILVGDWNFQRHVEELVRSRHADLLGELEAAKKALQRAESRNYDHESLARDMRRLADRIDPPVKDE